MGFYDVVVGCIIFICCLFMFYIMRLFALPFDIGFPSLDPRPVTMFIWNIVTNILLIVFVIILVVVLILYAIDQILRYIPLIGPIIRRSTPFKELRQLQIFALIDSVRNILSSGFSKESFKKCGVTIAMFFYNSWHFTQKHLNRFYKEPDNDVMKNKKEKGPKVEGEMEVLTQSERFQVRDEYVKCLRENMYSANPKDPPIKHKLVDIQNQSVRTKCQVLNIRTYLKILFSQRKLFDD